MIEQEVRPDRQHRVGRRQGRQPERLALQRVEGGRDRAHQVARQGARRQGRARQRGRAGGGEDGDVRDHDASSTSTSCCRRSRWGASSRSAEAAAMVAWLASRGVLVQHRRRCSTSRAAAPPTDRVGGLRRCARAASISSIGSPDRRPRMKLHPVALPLLVSLLGLGCATPPRAVVRRDDAAADARQHRGRHGLVHRRRRAMSASAAASPA